MNLWAYLDARPWFALVYLLVVLVLSPRAVVVVLRAWRRR